MLYIKLKLANIIGLDNGFSQWDVCGIIESVVSCDKLYTNAQASRARVILILGVKAGG